MKGTPEEWIKIYELYQSGEQELAMTMAIDCMEYIIRSFVSKCNGVFASKSNTAAEKEDLIQSMYCIICDKLGEYHPYPNGDGKFVSGSTFLFHYLQAATSDFIRGGDGMNTGASKYESNKIGLVRLKNKSLEEALEKEEPDGEVSRALYRNACQSTEDQYFQGYLHPALKELEQRTRGMNKRDRECQLTLLASILELQL